jgi:hypothetical protein
MVTAIVCGGRDFSDSKYLESCLNQCRKWWGLTHIITGEAKGADSLAHHWALKRDLDTDVFHAQWDTYGKGAGMIRNRLMLAQLPQVVIAFKGGVGTENMITITRQARIPVLIL